MNKYLSLRVWSTSEVALAIFAAAVLLAATTIVPVAVLTLNGAILGIFGALILQHFALHGWTLWSGNVGQRAVLFVFWLIAVVIGGTVASLIDF